MPETRALIVRLFERERRMLRRGIAILILIVVGVGWVGDHRSCQRQQAVRGFIEQDRQINLAAEAYWLRLGRPEIAERIRQRLAAEATVHPLSCWRPVPGD